MRKTFPVVMVVLYCIHNLTFFNSVAGNVTLQDIYRNRRHRPSRVKLSITYRKTNKSNTKKKTRENVQNASLYGIDCGLHHCKSFALKE